MTENFQNEPEVLALINEGRVVEAIKALRASRGIGLKEAKDVVDSYRQEQGLSQPRSMPSDSKVPKSNLSWVLLVALVVFGYYFFKR